MAVYTGKLKNSSYISNRSSYVTTIKKGYTLTIKTTLKYLS